MRPGAKPGRKAAMKMKYQVSQTFETLGDTCATIHETREAAERTASALRAELAAMVAAIETDGSEDSLGFAHEVEAWAEARELADGAETYGAEAGAYIAGQAVTIDEVQE